MFLSVPGFTCKTLPCCPTAGALSDSPDELRAPMPRTFWRASCATGPSERSGTCPAAFGRPVFPAAGCRALKIALLAEQGDPGPGGTTRPCCPGRKSFRRRALSPVLPSPRKGKEDFSRRGPFWIRQRPSCKVATFPAFPTCFPSGLYPPACIAKPGTACGLCRKWNA